MSNSIESIEQHWLVKYRPQNISDVCLPNRLRKRFASGNVDTHLLFCGKPGVGKTTLAKVLCKNHTVKYFNGSDDRKIETIRQQVVEFCSTTSLMSSSHKVVYFEEAEKLTKDAQDALKAVIENFESTVKFIFTTNHPEKIDDALISRFEVVDFDKYTEDEINDTKVQYGHRIISILASEGYSITPALMRHLLHTIYPDFRKIIGTLYALSKLATGNRLHIEQIDQIQQVNDSKLFDFLLSLPDDATLYQFVRTNYAISAGLAIDILCSGFLDYVWQSKFREKTLHIAALMHQLKFESGFEHTTSYLALMAYSQKIIQVLKS